ncbi:SCP2 sterol-binding domain-containing protein [Deltaproteobacteria bacterium OttesenSCG-928-M10]|nr:SCP2 sterol-binding domain-containing protein [Deltaproteobacteria bacterium OttesenSCG-928-M10]
MNINELFNILTEKAAELTLDPELSAIVLFNLTGSEPAKWSGRVHDGRVGLNQGEPLDEPDITVTAESDTALAIYEKKLNPMMAFMTGKIKVKGDMSKVALIKGLLTGGRK